MDIKSDWVVEIGELAVLNKEDSDKMKHFVTDRRTVFIGTSALLPVPGEQGMKRYWRIK